MKKIITVLFCSLLFIFTSCVSFEASNLAVLEQGSSMKMLGHFEKRVLVSEFFGVSAGTNVFNISCDVMDDKLHDVIWKEIEKKGGNGAINVYVKYEASFWDMLANDITYGIWAPAHMEISGDVIQYSADIVGELETDEAISLAMNY